LQIVLFGYLQIAPGELKLVASGFSTLADKELTVKIEVLSSAYFSHNSEWAEVKLEKDAVCGLYRIVNTFSDGSSKRQFFGVSDRASAGYYYEEEVSKLETAYSDE
jgi:hypothetical protein